MIQTEQSAFISLGAPKRKKHVPKDENDIKLITLFLFLLGMTGLVVLEYSSSTDDPKIYRKASTSERSEKMQMSFFEKSAKPVYKPVSLKGKAIEESGTPTAFTITNYNPQRELYFTPGFGKAIRINQKEFSYTYQNTGTFFPQIIEKKGEKWVSISKSKITITSPVEIEIEEVQEFHY